ncbi:MAG TPA: S1C family serine protease, partial [Burkholderiales bacterium]|nr:S1C family serine protease [Burkholderiales bacterium]
NRDLRILMRKGYFVIGYSSIDGPGKIGGIENQIREQAANVGAQAVLVAAITAATPSSARTFILPNNSSSFITGKPINYKRGEGGYEDSTAKALETQTGIVLQPYKSNRPTIGGVVYLAKRRYGLGLLFVPLDHATSDQFHLDHGVIVNIVVDGTPAFHAHILPGDVILALDNEKILSPKGFISQLRSHAGERIVLKLSRAGKIIEKTVQLDALQAKSQS